MRTTPCSTCGAPTIWTVTATGKRMQVNAAPDTAGRITLAEVDGTVYSNVRAIGSPGYTEAQKAGALYVSHFSTCPQAEEWRQRKPKGSGAGEPRR